MTSFTQTIPAGSTLRGVGSATKGLRIRVQDSQRIGAPALCGNFTILSDSETHNSLMETHLADDVSHNSYVAFRAAMPTDGSVASFEDIHAKLVDAVGQDPSMIEIVNRNLLNRQVWALDTSVKPIGAPFTKQTAASIKTILHIFTDLGEECDDEVTILTAIKRALGDETMYLRVIFSDADWKSHLQSLIDAELGTSIEQCSRIELVSICDMCQLETVSTIKQNVQEVDHRVLLIGPTPDTVTDEMIKTFVTTCCPYKAAIVGTIGRTLNSQGSAKDRAVQLLAKEYIVVDTARGAGAPSFSLQALNDTLGLEMLKSHVAKIGFRTVFGRANEVKGDYIAGLVAKMENHRGANYEVIANLDVGDWRGANLPKAEVDHSAIQEVVDTYMKNCTKWPDTMAQNKFPVLGNNNPEHSINGASFDEIREGYSEMLQKSYDVFGVPVALLRSQHWDSGKKDVVWNKAWDDVDKADDQTTHHFEEEKITKAMKLAFNNWMSCLTANPTMALTPAYDCVGLYAILKMGTQDFSSYFLVEGDNVVKLRRGSTHTEELKQILSYCLG